MKQTVRIALVTGAIALALMALVFGLVFGLAGTGNDYYQVPQPDEFYIKSSFEEADYQKLKRGESVLIPMSQGYRSVLLYDQLIILGEENSNPVTLEGIADTDAMTRKTVFKDYEVRYDLQGGSVQTPQALTSVLQNCAVRSITLPPAEKEEHAFKGWTISFPADEKFVFIFTAQFKAGTPPAV